VTTRLLSLQLLLAFAVANARNDPPPTSDRAWSPQDLRNYERDLAEQRFKTAPGKAWKAYTDFKTALRKQDSAAKLVIASQNAFDAVLESYKQGLSTYPEIVSAERNLASARSVSHDTQSAIFTAATALALSTGDLARPSSRPLRPLAVRSLER
jgi:outer membrane protein TolC